MRVASQRTSSGLFAAATAVMLAALAVCAPAAQAAELKISLSELARILNVTLKSPQVRLHNVPSGMFDLTPGSSLSIGGGTIPLAVPARSFDVAGGSYGYYVSELNSQSVTISAVPSALRVTVVFESEGPEVVGRCVSGLCVANSALPELEWIAPSVQIDLTPVWVNGKLSLDAKRVDVGGTFAAECEGGGFVSGTICRLALPKAKKVAGSLKIDLAVELKKLINGPQAQAQIADGLRPFLRFGPVGEVRFSKVAVDSQNVTITFCLACQAE